MRLTPVPILLLSLFLVPVACGSAYEGAPTRVEPDSGPNVDSGPEPLSDGGTTETSTPTTITVTTRNPTRATLGTPVNARWAAYQDETGAWKALTPMTTGTYSFTTTGPKWGVAATCSSNDDINATVYVYYRTAKTTSLDIPFSQACPGLAFPATHTLSGTLSNIGGSAAFLSFGSAGRGTGTSLTAGAYTVDGVGDGTTDLAYGVRTAFDTPILKMLLKRGEVINGDKTLDIDMNGTNSFVPGSKNIVVRGALVGERLEGEVQLTMQGSNAGIPLEAGSVPQTAVSTFAYSTATATVATDVYRGRVFTLNRDTGIVTREISFDLKTPIDLDLTLPPAPAGANLTLAGTTPYVRVRTKASLSATTDTVLVQAHTYPDAGGGQNWSISYDSAVLAGVTAFDDTTPDLSKVPGWNNNWVPAVGGDVTVTVSVSDTATALASDGHKVQTSTADAVLKP